MGYESKIYIVEKRSQLPSETKRYAQVIAMFDMCKFYFLSDSLRRKPKTDCYFYADDGNTEVLEDKYGDELRETTPKVVINLLEKAIKNGVEYRRIFPLLSALKTIEEQRANGMWDDIAVLHYGY